MPPGPSRAQHRRPTRLVLLGRLPQRKVPRRVLLVLVRVHPRAVLDPLQIFLRQLPILRKPLNPEVPAPILRLVRNVLGRQLLDQCHHLRNVLGGARHMLRPFDPQRLHVLEERLLKSRRVLADRLLRRQSVADDLVVHVRHVHRMFDGHALLAQEPPQHVHMQKRPEVPNVPVVVDRWPAGIHPQRRPAHRLQPLHLSAQCIEQFQRRHSTHRRIQRKALCSPHFPSKIAQLRFYIPEVA